MKFDSIAIFDCWTKLAHNLRAIFGVLFDLILLLFTVATQAPYRK